MSQSQNPQPSDNAFVETLVLPGSDVPFGLRLNGASAGPQVVVAGTCDAAQTVFDRLLSIPTLPWMRGSLVMIQLETLDGMLGDLSDITPLGPIDRTVVLPWANNVEPDELQIRRNYHMVLRLCADMGMIAGRGVAR